MSASGNSARPCRKPALERIKKEIEALTRELYADTPQGTLYHYATFSGLPGIVKSRALRTSDIRYMNDSAEARERIDGGRAGQMNFSCSIQARGPSEVQDRLATSPARSRLRRKLFSRM